MRVVERSSVVASADFTTAPSAGRKFGNVAGRRFAAHQGFDPKDRACTTRPFGPDRQRMRARKAEVALYAEAIGKPYRGDLRQAEASKLGTAETKVGEAEQGVAVIGKLGREPCRRTHRVEQLDHRHRVRSEEHTSELQSQ